MDITCTFMVPTCQRIDLSDACKNISLFFVSKNIPFRINFISFLKWRRLSWQNFDRRQRLSPTNYRENVLLSPLPPLSSTRNEACPAWRSNPVPGFLMDRNRTGSCPKNRSRRAKMRRRQLESWWTTIHKDCIGNKDIRLKFSSLVRYTVFMSCIFCLGFSSECFKETLCTVKISW